MYADHPDFEQTNAIAGEIMAIENYSEMVPLMPDTESKIEAVKQAHEETKHILMLGSLGRRHDYNMMREIVEPQWFNIRRHFSTAVANKDLASCLIIQDLMTETMAIVLYRTLGREGDSDTSALAARILEVEHQIYPLAIRLFTEGRLSVEGRRVVVRGPRPPLPPALVHW